MNGDILTSISVSVLAMSVIFVVLTLLIFTINILVYFIPYKAPPPPPPKRQPAAKPSEEDEHVAAIVGALATHLNRPPDQFHIKNITSR